ncbi:hypothetical protein UCDDA912_g04318 [Diaporthe ampelina]|uniref:Tesmin/TSO1-like CXC domain-containing protein n=1 Tax=Diaporthe ampelina TaxID=1214573 RepID=A0A0G2I7A0_9PEZI|nr:hypothetical protein UCDDA912_g04318 [Diaporthe ampelina]
MKTLAGSKRTAGTPFASPTKAAASAKRSRTQYDYYDEEDSKSPAEDQWSPDMDSGSDMSLDEDEERDSLGDKYTAGLRGPRSDRDLLDTEAADIHKEPIHLPPAASVPCGRGSTNTKTKGCIGCDCSKWGKQCNASGCGCQGGAACRNPFRKLDLSALFGQEPVALHPCFTTWVAKQTKAKLERTNTQSLFDLVLESAFMLDEYQDNVTEPYLEWRTRWDTLTAAERDSGAAGLALKQELLRWGLTSRNLQSIYFSFCRKDGDVDGSAESEFNELSDNDSNYWWMTST